MAGGAHNKTILLTGAAGFIGSNVLEYLYDKYPTYRFIVLDALTYAGKLEHIPDHIRESGRFEFHHGDVQNQELVDRLVAQSDAVVHFAAETHVEHSIYDNYRFFETDILGTLSVTNAVLAHEKTVDRFIHISTCEVYGAGKTERMDEHHLLDPHSPYAAAKAGADRLVYSYIKTYGIPAIILRPFNIIGPRQHIEKVLPRFISSALLGTELTVHGHGKAARDFMYVDGVSDMVDRLLHVPKEKVVGEVFNIGSGVATSVLDLAKLVVSELTYPAEKIAFVPDRPGQVESFVCDYTKARRVLGWEPPCTLKEGVARTIAWFRDNRPLWDDQLDAALPVSGTRREKGTDAPREEAAGEGARIKILFGINKLTIGGAERLLVNEINGLDRSRFDPYLVTLLPSSEPNFDSAVAHLGEKWKKFSFAGLLDVVSWWRLYAYLKRERFDVVISNLFLTSLMLRTAAIAAGVPVILSTELNVYKRSPFWRWIERTLAPFTHRIIANSTEVLETAARDLGLPKEKFVLNYSTVDLREVRPASVEERNQARVRYGIPNDAFVIVSAGRLVEQKGQQYLIDAFALLPETVRNRSRLVIFGEGARREELTARIAEKGLEASVTLPGAAPIADIIALADMFVLPSLWEGMPVVLLEAMAGGLPVVATDVSGSREVVVDGRNGYLVPVNDSAALAEKLGILAGDESLRKRFGEASRQEAGKYSIENHLAALTSAIQDGVARRA